MAIALDEVLERDALRRWLTPALLLLVACNFWFASLTWLKLSHTSYYLAEQWADAHVARGTKLAMLSTWELPAGSTRLESHGRLMETRPVQEWSRSREGLPDVVFVSSNKFRYLFDAKRMPAREEMLAEESGFRVSDWHGLTVLGYAETAREKWELPAWYPFGCLPLGDMVEPDLLVFERTHEPAATHVTSAR
jgi:hypothetical protein